MGTQFGLHLVTSETEKDGSSGGRGRAHASLPHQAGAKVSVTACASKASEGSDEEARVGAGAFRIRESDRDGMFSSGRGVQGGAGSFCWGGVLGGEGYADRNARGDGASTSSCGVSVGDGASTYGCGVIMGEGASVFDGRGARLDSVSASWRGGGVAGGGSSLVGGSCQEGFKEDFQGRGQGPPTQARRRQTQEHTVLSVHPPMCGDGAEVRSGGGVGEEGVIQQKGLGGGPVLNAPHPRLRSKGPSRLLKVSVPQMCCCRLNDNGTWRLRKGKKSRDA